MALETTVEQLGGDLAQPCLALGRGKPGELPIAGDELGETAVPQERFNLAYGQPLRRGDLGGRDASPQPLGDPLPAVPCADDILAGPMARSGEALHGSGK